MILAVLVAIPTAASLLTLGLARRAPLLARGVALLGAVLTTVVALMALVGGQSRQDIETVGPIQAGEITVALHLHGGSPVLLIAAVVALVSLCVQIYAADYLRDDDRVAVFAAVVALFTAAMLLVVVSADLVLTVVGWEVMGWCSYLLIGHWSRKAGARRAAHKAFMVTRVADIGFVLGVVILIVGAGSSGYGDVLAYWAGTGACADSGVGACVGPDAGLRSLAMVLLVIGVLGKSAQFPFHDWLPDAMEGPTPASALIHAATMVAAGTFVLDQLAPVLVLADPARGLLAATSAVTMVGGAVLAYLHSDLKRLLAWSTVSQIAIMLAALAAAPPQEIAGAGVLHLYAHAWFKALLFLTIGWFSLVAGSTAATRLRAVARRNQLGQTAFLFGLLALAGVPFVVGGVSKEHVIAVVWDGARAGSPGGWIVLTALLTTVALTAAYATRAWLIVMAAEEHPQIVNDEPVIAPAPMSAPIAVVLVVLLAGTVFGALVLLTGAISIHAGMSIGLLLLTVLLILIGVVLALLLREGPVRPGSTIERGAGADAAYGALMARPVLALARFAAELDDRLIDATARSAARATHAVATRTARVHDGQRPATGLVWILGAGLLLGAVGVLAWR